MAKRELRGKHTGNERAARLPGELEKSLLNYAAAATAAGVGLLALAASAEARIVYTRANEQIVPDHRFPLDLNHDKKTDFTLVDTVGAIFFTNWGVLTAYPNRSGNAIWGYQATGGLRFASALPAGFKLGPNKGFSLGQKVMAQSTFLGGRRQYSTSCKGPWKGAINRYLGFQFKIKTETHYGWARLNITCNQTEVTGTLTGYAYETIPNKPIITGRIKSADDNDVALTTLGRLALGRK